MWEGIYSVFEDYLNPSPTDFSLNGKTKFRRVSIIEKFFPAVDDSNLFVLKAKSLTKDENNLAVGGLTGNVSFNSPAISRYFNGEIRVILSY